MKENSNEANPQKEMKRREFIRASATLAAGAGILGLGSTKAFGAGTNSVAQTTIENVTLNNGVQMPILGFGTLYLNGEKGAQCVADALSLGYRLIDTATIYGNEEAVGAGIKKSGIDRKELFVTSKLWVDDSGYEKGKAAFQTSLDKLGLDYLDLYLIHRPRGDVKGSWKIMEELHKEGKIKAIGISNFEDHQIDELLGYATIKPAVNQIETHAFFQQSKARKSLLDYGVQMEAWSPLAQGRNELFTNETLAAIGKKYNKNNAQVSLRWHYQRGIVAIPRSSQKAHMMENLNIFDFELSDSDMKTIAALDLDKTQFPEWE
ncbi:2,5-diketo-D-gluconate reductase A [Draconibacterium orientale]|uniref:2,5-diketo-D-gluconate reductase A n=1 Tax=Draconibacterium orientale TaxID=1168034 RepID=A0A1I0G5V8_9BACT|nr:aldo/keto reductase [Draconibacterium orientale]SET66128.1 2,5-diketo-D-gluconate reductase A [Draconibacterium orientale]